MPCAPFNGRPWCGNRGFMGFESVFTNVLMTLIFILPGFLLCKVKKASADHLSTISAVLVYVCSPCMLVSNFLSLDYTPTGLLNMALFFAAALVLQLLFMLILFLLLRKRYDDAGYRILTIGAVTGNVGFFGLPVVRSLLPDNPEVLCYSSMYVLSMNILVYTIGVYCLTRDKSFISAKVALINPSTIALVIALPLYIFGAKEYIPDVFIEGVRLLGNMATPVCMIILGIRLATMSLKKVFGSPKVYVVCLCKLVIYPLFCFMAVYFLPLDFAFKASILILSGAPCASVVFNMAEIHHSGEEMSANCMVLSTLICLVTLPLLTFLLQIP